MAKSKGSWWKDLLGTLGPAAAGAAGTFQAAARATIDEAQERVKQTVRMVLKAVIVFFIMALGFIYVLNGLGTWLETSNAWAPGLGAMIVGGALVLLGLFAWVMRG